MSLFGLNTNHNQAKSLTAYGTALVTGFISFLILVRVLKPDEFGMWVLFVTITGIAEMTRTGLIQNALIKKLHEEEEDREVYLGSGFYLSLFSAILLGLFVVFIASMIELAWGIEGFSILCYAYPIFSLINSVLKFREFEWMSKSFFGPVALSRIIYGSGFISGLVFWIVFTDQSIAFLPWIQVVSVLIALIAIQIIYVFPKVRYKIDFESIKSITVYGRFVMGTNLGSMLFNKLDVLMLGGFLGPSAVGLYNAASKIVNLVEVPLSSVSQVCYPRITRAFNRADMSAITMAYEETISHLLAILMPVSIILILASKSLIILFAGTAYADASIVLIWLSSCLIIKPWGRIFGVTMDAIGHARLNFYLLVLSLVLAIVLNIVFIPILGVEGVALATVLTLLINAITGQLIIMNKISISISRIFKGLPGSYIHIIKQTKKNIYGIRIRTTSV